MSDQQEYESYLAVINNAQMVQKVKSGEIQV